MSIVLAAIVPHPPVILEAIGREHARLLERTAEAYGKVSEALAAADPQTILVISPHLQAVDDTFTVNHAPEYGTHFLEFGDFAPERRFKTDSLLVERIRHAARQAGVKVLTVSEPHLDYGSGVPLKVIPAGDSRSAAVVVGPTLGPPKSQFAFGQVLKEAVMSSNRRVAIICSGDLSHRLSSDTPGGFSPKGQEFNDLLVGNLMSGSSSSILQMNPGLVEEAHACGYAPICMFMGIMDRVNFTPELLANESPFGVGYMTMLFHLK